MSINQATAAAIVAADHDVVVVPLVLVKALGGLDAAAFLRQAVYLSAVMLERQPQSQGWFFLPQESEPGAAGLDPADGIFSRLGSWRECLGLSLEKQIQIRRQLKGLGLLCETRKGLSHGVLHYQCSPIAYLNFLAKCGKNAAAGNPSPAPVPAKKRSPSPAPVANRQLPIDQSAKPGMINRQSPVDIEEEDFREVDSMNSKNPSLTAAAPAGAAEQQLEPAAAAAAALGEFLILENQKDRDGVSELLAQLGEIQILSAGKKLFEAAGGKKIYVSKLIREMNHARRKQKSSGLDYLNSIGVQ
jgi:hypothetical protein